MIITSGDPPSNPPHFQTHPWIIPRTMASRLLKSHTNRVYLSQVSLPKEGPCLDLSQQFASSILMLMPPAFKFMALIPHGFQGNTADWIYGSHIELLSLPSMNSVKKKQEQFGAKQWRMIRNPNGRDMEVVSLFLSIQQCMGFTVCACHTQITLTCSDITK